ncbi:MAG: hypothetical protein Q4B60_08525 [Erysipelotrichaceae bacterium]|nr:hypothetical protein [Erysipelotrichaceae bacterium]
MKKLLATLLAVMMVVVCATSVFAAGSINADAAASNGVSVTVKDATASGDATVGTAPTAAEEATYQTAAAAVLPAGAKITKFFTINGTTAQTLTFDLTGTDLTNVKEIGLIHITATGAEKLVGTLSGATLTVNVSSFSPFAFYMTYNTTGGSTAAKPVVNTAVK